MVVVPPTASISGFAATISVEINADGMFAPLGDAEPILFPRFDVVERGAGSGVDFSVWRVGQPNSLPHYQHHSLFPFHLRISRIKS